MTIIFDGTQGITTPTETANNSVTTPVVKSGSALTLQTNGSTTAVTIDTSQNVGIGTISPQMRVDVSGGVRVQSITNPTSGSGMELAYDGTQGIIQAYSNRATLASVPVYLVTGQLRFPPTQNSSSNANTLDDYEEGTWTPVFGVPCGFTIGTINAANYTKIGNVVTAQCYITINGTGNSSQIFLDGLPFVAKVGGYWTSSLDMGIGGVLGTYVRVNAGSTECVFLYSGGGTSGSTTTARQALLANQCGANYIIFSVTYQTA